MLNFLPVHKFVYLNIQFYPRGLYNLYNTLYAYKMNPSKEHFSHLWISSAEFNCMSVILEKEHSNYLFWDFEVNKVAKMEKKKLQIGLQIKLDI